MGATRKRTWIGGGVATAALLALLVWAFAPRPVPVETATARIGRFERTVDEDARTRVRDRYAITAPLAGRVSRIALREGDAVEHDATLATLTPALPPMLDARTEAQLAARVETADAAVDRAAARIALARTALAQARNTLKREEGLARDRFIAASQLENDRLAVRAAEQDLESAKEDHHVAGHELEQARAALAAARDDDVGAFAVRAPVSGRVLRVTQTSEGMVALGAPLLELGDTAQMEIVAELLTTDALQATPGMPVRIERWGGPKPLAGRVRRVEPAGFTKISALGVEEQRVNVLIDLTGPREDWRSLGDGFRVGVRIVVVARDDALLVPVSAVFPRPGAGGDGEVDGARPMAVFAIQDGRARLREVAVGGRNGSDAWIVSGLRAGERVIVYPGDAVAEGVRVEPRTVAQAR
ncbi:MAG: efflux RND transporter periplasmic adaptor subunit [Pseudomonadota bacterium]